MKAIHLCFGLCCFVLLVQLINAVTEELIKSGNEEDSEDSVFGNVRWTYKFTEYNKCERQLVDINEEQISLETCLMLYSSPQLWPYPRSITFAYKNSTKFSRQHIFLKIHSPIEVKELIQQAANIFLRNLPGETDHQLEDNDFNILKINIHVISNEDYIQLGTNESYELYVQKIEEERVLTHIYAPTFFGARHALETLSQLIWFDSISNKLRVLHDVRIEDNPKFPHRGLSIDTARNFFPINLLKKVVDGMAASKLNVLHLHLTDSVSFPVVLPHNKKFSEFGAYSQNKTYSPKDIKDLIYYAKLRGMRTILEVDAPGHVNAGWPDDVVMCGKDNIQHGQLNPDNNNTLEILENIYKDLLELGSDSETFHIGGDEVNLDCWKDTKSSKDYGNINAFWASFTNKMIEKVKAANNDKLPQNVVLWSSPLTDHYLNLLNNPNNLVVQYWFGRFDHILTGGFKLLFSTVGHWYLDCGFGPWNPGMGDNGVCDPYTSWQKFYRYRPWENYPNYIQQILGGEACLWSEQVSEDTLETRLWPRAAAFAERLWSDQLGYENYDVYTRLTSHSQRLKNRGLDTAAIWPGWCSLNPEKC